MKIRIWGMEVLDIDGLEQKETVIHYDHCVFGQPIPIMVAMKKEGKSERGIKRGVISEKVYLEMVKKVADKTGINASEVEWVLREAEGYLGEIE